MAEAEPAAILCFGDSNTWGNRPGPGRFGVRDRWCGILDKELGDEFHVVEEGLLNRMTVWNDPLEDDVNGSQHLGSCLRSHHPIDLVVMMMGTSELRARFGLTADSVALGVGVLADTVLSSEAWAGAGSPQLMIIAPPTIGSRADSENLYEGAKEKSEKLVDLLSQLASQRGCRFFDASAVVSTSTIDGVHLDVDGHRDLGKALVDPVRSCMRN